MTKTNYGIYINAFNSLQNNTDIEPIKQQTFFTIDYKSFCGIIKWKEVVLLNGLFSLEKGYGVKLIEDVILYYGKPILINVTGSNDKLVSYYESLGFKMISEEKTTILMRLDV